MINFSLLINSSLGSLVSDQAPRAIDAAFRIYMLPQGMFASALATVLFPTLSRFAARDDLDGLRRDAANGVRQFSLLLIPATAIFIALSEPITRLIYQHGAFGTSSTDQVSEALFWFSFALPLNGVNLLLTRTFFSFQRPWLPVGMAPPTSRSTSSCRSRSTAARHRRRGHRHDRRQRRMAAGQVYYLRRELRRRSRAGRRSWRGCG